MLLFVIVVFLLYIQLSQVEAVLSNRGSGMTEMRRENPSFHDALFAKCVRAEEPLNTSTRFEPLALHMQKH